MKNIIIENLQILGQPVSSAAAGDISVNEHATGIDIKSTRGITKLARETAP